MSFYTHNTLSGPTKAVCYREASAIRGVVIRGPTVHRWEYPYFYSHCDVRVHLGNGGLVQNSNLSLIISLHCVEVALELRSACLGAV